MLHELQHADRPLEDKCFYPPMASFDYCYQWLQSGRKSNRDGNHAEAAATSPLPGSLL